MSAWAFCLICDDKSTLADRAYIQSPGCTGLYHDSCCRSLFASDAYSDHFRKWSVNVIQAYKCNCVDEPARLESYIFAHRSSIVRQHACYKPCLSQRNSSYTHGEIFLHLFCPSRMSWPMISHAKYRLTHAVTRLLDMASHECLTTSSSTHSAATQVRG